MNNRLSALVSVVSAGDNAPTKQSAEVRDMLLEEIDQNMTKLNEVFEKGVAQLNEAIKNSDIPAIFVGQDNPQTTANASAANFIFFFFNLPLVFL